MTSSNEQTPKRRIDVNCDLGETSLPWYESHEPALLREITSANVACGGHAGDSVSMLAVCAEALRLGVALGAQVSYPDRENFGRVAMEIATDELSASLSEQFLALIDAATTSGSRVAYVKPHGALYNTVVTRVDHAEVVVQLAAQHGLPLFGLPNSVTESLALQHGVRFVREWFADRGYLSDGHLVPRSRPDALVTSPDLVFTRVLKVLQHGVVDTVDGAALPVDFATICVHSDTPGAAALLQSVRAALTQADIHIGAAW